MSSLLCTQWDEGLLTMTKGEKAELVIEPDWAYGKKGKPDAKYPNLLFTKQASLLTNLSESTCRHKIS